jgi:hypothetical protein
VKRWLWRAVKAIGLLLLPATLAAVAAGWTNFGHRATGARRDRMAQSPQWHGGEFVNPQPIINHVGPTLRAMLSPDPATSPSAPPPTASPDLSVPPASGLRVIWLGHSSTLVEIDGQRILTDPMWSERPTPRAAPLVFASPTA